MNCKKCGGRLESYANNCAFCGEPVAAYDTKAKYVGGDSQPNKEHTSTVKWFFLPFINLIPIVGPLIYLIKLFIWGLGSSKNDDLTFKNFARAQLLYMLVGLVFGIIALVIFIATVGSIEFPNLPSFP